MKKDYEDIIDLPHHVSEYHARMPMMDRAAQFSPFAALTGYEAAVQETARLTDARVSLTEEETLILDAKLRRAAESRTIARITYFIPDDEKSGGAYACVTGRVRKLDHIRAVAQLTNGQKIHVLDIVEIELPELND